MAAIQTLGTIAALQPSWSPGMVYSGVRLYDSFNYDYAALYRMQPNVRTCVDFLARNVAQLGLHSYRRVSDTDRVRLMPGDHGLPQMLSRPLPPDYKMTSYRLIEALMGDLGVYFNAFWLKLRQGKRLSGLLRIPPIYMTIEGGLIPTKYTITAGGMLNELQPSEIVHFRGYNPENAISGLSPLETLRRVLAEEQAAGKYREEFWQNAARMRGIIERPAEAPEWSDPARERFMAEFAALYAGEETGGKTAVLEEGMKFTAGSFNPQESEYLGGRRLTREECARAYHIPLPMVGILEHATFSNITEQHKNLYQDSLGPWLVMIEQDIELQLLPEFPDSQDVYIEFNIMDKLAGSFEDQIKALQSAIGRPWMTPNEGRARLNMSSLGGDADELATPLNVIVGGQASPRDSAPPATGLPKSAAQTKARGVDSHFPALRARYAEKWTSVLTSFYRRQERTIVSQVPDTISAGKSVIGGSVWWDDERWNSELGADLLKLNRVTTLAYAEAMAGKLGEEVEDWEAFEARMLPWLSEHSRIQAESINEHTKTALDEALNEPEALEAVKNVFVLALSAWVGREVVGAITSAASFGSMEAARASRRIQSKTWHVNSGNPRPSHAAMDGMRIPIGDLFPNGQKWPGDPQGSADENANCQCSVEFS